MSTPSPFPEKSTGALPASTSQQQQQPRKLTALERNNLKWESHKDNIRRMYMNEDTTLEETMQWFKQERGFDWR